MTQKDLLYLEDAVGHETNLMAIYTHYLKLIEDSTLKKLIQNQIKDHAIIKERLLKTMEEMAHE